MLLLLRYEKIKLIFLWCIVAWHVSWTILIITICCEINVGLFLLVKSIHFSPKHNNLTFGQVWVPPRTPNNIVTLILLVSKGSRKIKNPPLMAGPLRNFFWNFFFILLPFKNKNYFTLDNISKYGHITLKFVGRYFDLVVTIFSKK